MGHGIDLCFATVASVVRKKKGAYPISCDTRSYIVIPLKNELPYPDILSLTHSLMMLPACEAANDNKL